jgi:DNA-binding NarL/FixJ family response regulator
MQTGHQPMSPPAPAAAARPGPSRGRAPSLISALPDRPVRVALLCATALLREGLQEVIHVAPDLRLWEPTVPGPPDVVLWVAESGAGLQVLRQSPFRDPWRGAVLLDTAGRLGPAGAGLQGFLGYLPPEVESDRLRLCLRRVAVGQPDAPEPHLGALVRALAAPPLEPLDQEILRLLALGRSQRQMEAALGISERTLQRRITALQERLAGSCGHHLGAIAVALGLGWPWDGEPSSALLSLSEPLAGDRTTLEQGHSGGACRRKPATPVAGFRQKNSRARSVIV